MSVFDWPIRVYYEDTDSGGVVYHANYLNFMERARTEWLRWLGFEQDALNTEYNCIFAVHSIQLNYRQPARFNDALIVRSEISRVAGASFLVSQKVLRNDELLCDAVVKVACINKTDFKPMAMPTNVITEIKSGR